MNRIVMKCVWLLLAASFLGGCSTIFDGTQQSLTFISNPDDATVTVNGRVIGKTPITTSIKKEKGQTLTFSKDGYKTITMQLETHLDSWFWGNIVIGGFLGSTTDAASGAMNEYSPSQYMITLQPEGTTSADRSSSMDAQQKAKEFIVLAYNDILKDINKDGGQYETSLFQTLNIPKEGQSEAIKKIRALSEAYTNIPEFADRVIAIYLK